MKYVHILVEGQTEEEFVRDILNEYLAPQNIYLNAIVAKTKKAVGGNAAYRGGIVSYSKIEPDIRRLIRDSNAGAATTMMDYYGLPTDFPGYSDSEAKNPDCHKAVAYLEGQFAADIGDNKFIPYLSIHEFEGLLFSNPDKIVTEVRGKNEKIAKTFVVITVHLKKSIKPVHRQNAF